MTTPEYHRGDTVDLSVIHAAFCDGFSDYLVPITMSEEPFEARFFGLECNRRELSFVALVDGTPAGVLLGGVRDLHGVRTMRMGAMAIAPAFRGRHGLGRGLFERHHQAAREAGCAQLWLEVVVGNDRAIAFYRRQGYEPVGRLHYYRHDDPRALVSLPADGPRVEPCTLAEARLCAPPQVHVNWQNQPFCIEQVPDQRSFVAIEQGEAVGAIGLDPTGTVDFLHVREPLRRRGLGTALLTTAARALGPDQLTVGLPVDPALDAFLLARGFERRQIEQYEMQRSV